MAADVTDDAGIAELFAPLVGEGNVLTGDAVKDDYSHDEALTTPPVAPLANLLDHYPVALLIQEP